MIWGATGVSRPFGTENVPVPNSPALKRRAIVGASRWDCQTMGFIRGGGFIRRGRGRGM